MSRLENRATNIQSTSRNKQWPLQGTGAAVCYPFVVEGPYNDQFRKIAEERYEYTIDVTK